MTAKEKFARVQEVRKVYKKLLEPAYIGNVRLKNRAVAAPMLEYWARADGEVTQRHLNYYREQAKGGVGLTIVSPGTIDAESSKEAESQLGLYHDRFLIGLRQLTENIHLYGGKACIQVVHAGLERYSGDYPLLVPSKKACLEKFEKQKDFVRISLPMHELTIKDIEEIIEKFADAIVRTKDAGFDMVELHGAHGYLITNFLSPLTNHRTDKYGGSDRKRMQFAIDIVKRGKEKAGADFPIGMRVSGSEYTPGGIEIDFTVALAKELEKAGLDFLHMSAGTNETADKQVPTYYMPHAHGYNIWLAERAKQELKIPVMIAGGLTVRIAETLLEKGQADFAAFGRPMLTDPCLIRKVEEGRPEDIRQCILCCDGCVDKTVRAGLGMRCSINVAMGREEQFAKVEYEGGDPAPVQKRVFVIGGGPAGMEAARIAARRGHDVTLFDKNNKLGGALLDAAIPHFKKDINRVRSFQTNDLKKLPVKIKLGKEVTVDDIVSGEADTVIVATGSKSIPPALSGVDKPIVADALEVLRGKKEVGEKVIIVGASMVGCELAWLLAEKKHNVDLVARNAEEVGYNIPFLPKTSYDELTAELPLKIHEGVTIKEITDNGVVVSKDEKEMAIEGDSVVVVSDFVPNTELLDVLCQAGINAKAVGDCIQFRSIHDAIYEGYLAGYTA